jgi:hypothetical protein
MSGGDDKYQSDFFSHDGLIYVAENTAPSHQDLVHLLHLCGAQVGNVLYNLDGTASYSLLEPFVTFCLGDCSC